jgi:hypothetical protein
MATPEFTALVTSLRDNYLRSAAEAEQSEERLPLGERLEYEFAQERQALPLGMVAFLQFYLHPDGRLIAYSTLTEEVTAEYTDLFDLAYGLRVGSRHHPELESLIPAQPDNATPCVACSNTGRMEDGDSWDACWQCHGLGWLAPGMESLIERTATGLHESGDGWEEIAALARQMFAEASVILGSSEPVLTYFDLAARRAGFDVDRRSRCAEIYERVTKPPPDSDPDDEDDEE